MNEWMWSWISSNSSRSMTASPSTSPTTHFAKFVDRALILRSDYPIQTFRLSFIFYHHFTSHLDSRLRCAVTRLRAYELHLDLFIDRQYHYCSEDGSAPNDSYKFHFALLRNACVERLSLMRVHLALLASMVLGSMRSMFLEEVNLTDQMWEHLIKGCPDLEDLELQNGMVELNMRIRSKSLKKLKFGYFYVKSFLQQ